jgi:hypothetical protein
MRGLDKVVLVHFVDTDEIAFIEWQTFRMGSFFRHPQDESAVPPGVAQGD